MTLAWSRGIAVLFAVSLGIGEAAINWGHWQYAPLWIVDYVIVCWLLWAVVATRAGQRVHLLLAAWAFATGVFYMALFVSLSPQLGLKVSPVLAALMGVMLAASVAGLCLAWLAMRTQRASAAGAAGRH
jgi:hypothetical protein